MGKIRYIEDEPDAYFMINVFQHVLSQGEMINLKESENDPDTVMEAVQSNPYMQLVTDFTQAIQIFQDELTHEDLLIVDRDLYGNGMKYQTTRLPDELHPPFDQTFFKREGDFLIHLARNRKFDLENRFWIFTGNDDPIRERDDLKYTLSQQFLSNNIIIKGSEGKNKLSTIIDKNFHLQIENKPYFDILEKKLSSITDDNQSISSSAQEFLFILEHQDDESEPVKFAVLSKCRIFIENICHQIARTHNAPDTVWKKNQPDQFGLGEFIGWMKKYNPQNQPYMAHQNEFEAAKELISLTRRRFNRNYQLPDDYQWYMGNILKEIAFQLNAPDELWHDKGKWQLNINQFERWVKEHTERNCYQLDSNIIIEQFLYMIHRIASGIAVHQNLLDYPGFRPTSNTVHALVSVLKEIILWFGQL